MLDGSGQREPGKGRAHHNARARRLNLESGIFHGFFGGNVSKLHERVKVRCQP
ncbi:hypothetical protein SDC9_189484 [bioreactor metagenome]|uniref:Uncharacterized protein n=1 Tax=bioreactor metagenome TaxID=1076179 RepID=A0A645HUR0_9ZZZZ